MNKKIRIIALLLTVLMLVGMLPLSLFAEETAATEATETEMSALDTLAAKAEGSPYELDSYETLAGYLGLGAGSKTGKNGLLVTEGYFGLTSSNTAGFISTAAAVGGASFTNMHTAPDSFVCSDGEFQIVDYPAGADVSVNYTAYGTTLTETAKYIVHSFEIKRGESQDTQYFARLRMYDSTSKGTKDFEIVARSGDQLNFSGIGAKGGSYGTSLFTTVTVAYDIVNDTMYAYANGVLIGTKADAYKVATNEYTFSKFQAVNWWMGSGALSGHIISLRASRAYFVDDAETFAKCVAEDATPANGVFKIDGDYYLFENNFPVIGATRTVEGYTVETEAKTGKIIACYKEADTSMYYDSWESADYKAAGVTLTKDNVNATVPGGHTDISGYAYTTETAEDGSTYYVVSPTKSVIQPKYNYITTVSDGVELTAKNAANNGAKYYSAIPSGATELKDETDAVIGYKTTTAPNKSIYSDISFYSNIASEYKSDEVANLNLRIRAGEGIRNTSIRVSYKIKDKAGTEIYDDRAKNYSPGTITVKDGVASLSFFGEDCGILRKDVYTDVTLRFYIKHDEDAVVAEGELCPGDLVCDVYVNGVLKAEAKFIRDNVYQYRIERAGVYCSTGVTWSKPLLTWGGIYFYYGDIVNTVEADAAYDGPVMTEDGTYTYTDGRPTAFAKNEYPDGNVYLRSYSVTLGEMLGVNFYATLSANAAKAVITVDGEEQVVDLTALTPGENGVCKISSKISSIKVADQIKLAFYDTDGKRMTVISTGDKVQDTYVTSVEAYSAYVVANADEASVAAVKALLNYAAYAEKYFGTSAAYTTAYSTTDRKTVPALDAATMAGTVYADGTDTSALGDIQLVLDNATKIRINLTKDAVVESEFDNVVKYEKDGAYYIDICEIDAANLDTVYTLTVDGTAVGINAIGVAAYVAQNEATYGADFANLMKALYLYSEACEALA